MYVCISVLNPGEAGGISLTISLSLKNEAAEDPVKDLDAKIINACQPVPDEESEPKSGPTPLPHITYGAPLEASGRKLIATYKSDNALKT